MAKTEDKSVAEENPYKAPQMVPAAVGGERLPWLRCCTSISVLGGTILLVAILATQNSFRGRFEEFELALPWSTQFALGPSLPSGLGMFVIASVIICRYSTGRRIRKRWNILSIVVLGFVAGHYVIAMFLPYITVDVFVP